MRTVSRSANPGILGWTTLDGRSEDERTCTVDARLACSFSNESASRERPWREAAPRHSQGAALTGGVFGGPHPSCRRDLETTLMRAIKRAGPKLHPLSRRRGAPPHTPTGGLRALRLPPAPLHPRGPTSVGQILLSVTLAPPRDLVSTAPSAARGERSVMRRVHHSAAVPDARLRGKRALARTGSVPPHGHGAIEEPPSHSWRTERSRGETAGQGIDPKPPRTTRATPGAAALRPARSTQRDWSR